MYYMSCHCSFVWTCLFHMTTYYEVVIQLLRKTCEETVQLLSCCLWRKKTRKKKDLDYLLVSYRGKRNRTKASRYKLLGLAVCLLIYFWNYLFFYLFVFIQYLLINLSVYLCIYLFHCLLCIFAWFWYREGGVSEQKGTKRLVERLRQ